MVTYLVVSAVRPETRDSFTGPASEEILEFGEFRLDGSNRLLTRQGEFLTLPARAFDTLLYLAQRPSELVTKDELLTRVWAGAFVEESNLTVAISTVRRVLGEGGQQRRFIQTVSGRGYRFIGEVRVAPPAVRGPC